MTIVPVANTYVENQKQIEIIYCPELVKTQKQLIIWMFSMCDSNVTEYKQKTWNGQHEIQLTSDHFFSYTRDVEKTP